MTNRMKMAAGAALLAAGLLAAPPDGIAQAQSARVATATEAQQRADFTRLLDSAKGLNAALKRISQERRLDYSGVIDKSERTLRAAEQAVAEGRMGEGRLLLDDAYLGSKLAIAEIARKTPPVPGGAAPAAVPGEAGQSKGYAERKESTRSLRDALARVAQEKADDKGRAEVAVIDKLIGDADAQLAAGNARQGRAILDHAYLRAKVQLERLRGGETLVRTLHFDSKADEYRYELDRNDTYRMLLALLVPNGSEREARLKDVLERAHNLRGEADAKAKGEAFDDALRLIEQSTGEYQKAIRDAGILIPG